MLDTTKIVAEGRSSKEECKANTIQEESYAAGAVCETENGGKVEQAVETEIVEEAVKNNTEGTSDISAEKEQALEPGKSIFELLEEDIMSSDMQANEKNTRLSRLIKMRERKVNIMLVGATGSGKSSTVNALFNMEVAKVGVGVDPETDSIVSYVLDNLTIWDTPGLGDGISTDEKYNNQIIRKLSELDEEGVPLIDLVLVVLDASSKDLGTSYDLINNVIIPCLGKDKDGRILIGLNQADMAMKGKHWDAENNVPDEVLLNYLKQKAESVQKRIKEGTGVSVRPVYYCAGYKEDGIEQCKPYNLTKLLYYIIQSIPKDKRLVIADNVNTGKDKWLHNDKDEDYGKEIKIGLLESIGFGIEDGAWYGGEIGKSMLGFPGKAVGMAIGGVCGAVQGFLDHFYFL